MIRDGRLPTPLEAQERRDEERERAGASAHPRSGGAKSSKSDESGAKSSAARDGMPTGKSVSSHRFTRPWPRRLTSAIPTCGAATASHHCGHA
jgi:hypothetical protein